MRPDTWDQEITKQLLMNIFDQIHQEGLCITSTITSESISYRVGGVPATIGVVDAETCRVGATLAVALAPRLVELVEGGTCEELEKR